MRDWIRQAYQRTREQSVQLIEGLSPEDAQVQSMPEASPVKWHLAHTTWFFETFLLERWEPGFTPFRSGFRVLYNSYYNGIGAQHPRPQRGLITRPGLHEVIAYRHDVDRRIERLIERYGDQEALIELLTLGLHHEQQHQELLLTDLKHLFSCHPEGSVYRPGFETWTHPREAARWIPCDGGRVEIGSAGPGFAFDNELPRHPVLLSPYQLASQLVTEGEYLEFIEAGGYQNPAYWLSEGWSWLKEEGIDTPLYWRKGEGRHECFTLGGWQPLEPDRPVRHVAYFEAEAYARYRGARLPTEAEWEAALSGETAPSIRNGCDWVWQWTQSSYAPYPGFREAPGAVGEYNGKFMVNQYVLRGGSLATPSGHARPTYRNFFPTTARWQFTGIRLARDGNPSQPTDPKPT